MKDITIGIHDRKAHVSKVYFPAAVRIKLNSSANQNLNIILVKALYDRHSGGKLQFKESIFILPATREKYILTI